MWNAIGDEARRELVCKYFMQNVYTWPVSYIGSETTCIYLWISFLQMSLESKLKFAKIFWRLSNGE